MKASGILRSTPDRSSMPKWRKQMPNPPPLHWDEAHNKKAPRPHALISDIKSQKSRGGSAPSRRTTQQLQQLPAHGLRSGGGTRRWWGLGGGGSLEF